MEVCKRFANVVALSSQTDYEHRLDQLNSLHDAWTNGNEIGIKVFDTDIDVPDTTDHESVTNDNVDTTN